MSRVDYLALYPCTVVVSSGSKADVIPDSSKLSSLSGVPIRTGVPGATAVVLPGSRCLLGFENGEPDQPFLSLWENNPPLSLTLAAPSISLVGTVSITGPLSIAGAGNLDIATTAGNMSISTTLGNVSLSTALGDVTVDTTLGSIKLGGATSQVARVGDLVAVDPVTHNGTITSSGQSKVLA